MSKTTPGVRRRVTVARAHAVANRILRRSNAAPPAGPHPDAGLLAVCATYGHIRQRADRLAKAATGTMSDDALEQADADLYEAGSAALAQIASRRAITIDGHRARAAAILAWDEGELIGLVDRYGVLQDRLLLALLADLVCL